ncbi:hypothetical protein D018_0491B, partial [Vibrio parahaemolyticus VP2007-007]
KNDRKVKEKDAVSDTDCSCCGFAE